MYSTLDSTRGRVFTYDSEGNLLYVFSGTGNIQGMARRPVSIEMYGENLLMLDAGRNQVIEFAPTEYGRLINTAIQMRYDGHDAAAVGAWQELVRLDENFALAWSGIGRSLLAARLSADRQATTSQRCTTQGAARTFGIFRPACQRAGSVSAAQS